MTEISYMVNRVHWSMFGVYSLWAGRRLVAPAVLLGISQVLLQPFRIDA
jgi:hypothetical protein